MLLRLLIVTVVLKTNPHTEQEESQLSSVYLSMAVLPIVLGEKVTWLKGNDKKASAGKS